MRQDNILPDLIAFNTLIHGYVKEENMDEAFNVFNIMEKEMKMGERGIEPDRYTYMSMINGHVAAGNSKEAFQLHDEMIHRGYAPDDKF
ncbi:hypothetical protein SETIT_1G115300v2 [Setaria italica]|uniref:Pentacotripeptide-repeat region of PRORP domain-containing protein n=1 Tax=Setaria italica TaxID=4555 RepID=K3YZ25_SETIT|nr:hypothetical protein SETIT_1G115300v2 [Setaria italica]